jgi:hypothetical protein
VSGAIVQYGVFGSIHAASAASFSERKGVGQAVYREFREF